MSIRDIIEAATPGPWSIPREYADGFEQTVADSTGDYIASFTEDAAIEPRNAAFIATFDPEHVALMEAVCEAAIRIEWDDNVGDWQTQEAVEALATYRKEHGL